MMEYNSLTPEEAWVIEKKGTERPFTGKYLKNKAEGTYTCKRCDAPLYYSEQKFESHCGWPSFDDEIPGAVRREIDADGRRVEILCSNCGGHLGHVFTGEGFTLKNTRHCVNSISMNFVPEKLEPKFERVLLASGAFWKREYFFQSLDGVVATRVGFSGGNSQFPTYTQVQQGVGEHAETVEITYDPKVISFEELLEKFFESHDFSNQELQSEYGGKHRSAIFYYTQEQKDEAEKMILFLKEKGYGVLTSLEQGTILYPADDIHQRYFERNGESIEKEGLTPLFS